MASIPRQDRVSLFTAICLVVANMIGTGIFTSLGFQVKDIQSGFSLLFLWVVGGVFAICGALSYAELAAALPRSGGEYHFISRIYHPALGFLAGLVSVLVGFAAPIAMGAMAFGWYLNQLWPGVDARWLSTGLVLVLSLGQLKGVALASRILDGFAVLKVILILGLIAAGLWLVPPQPITFAPTLRDPALILSAPFAISLVYVMYAYSGWNAAIYIIDEVRDAPRTLPRALFWGTGFVMVIYLLVTYAFLRSTPIAAMAGKGEVTFVVTQTIFGSIGAQGVALLISLTLISFVNAMIWTGPNVMRVMGEDFPTLGWLAHRSPNNVPSHAMGLQLVVVLVLLWSAKYDQIMVATQFALTSCSLLTAVGVLVLRWSDPQLPRPYRVWGYPLTPLLFAAISLFMLYYVIRDRPTESLGGAAFLVAGLILYFYSNRKPPVQPQPTAHS